ncbi:hypothetical protein L9F63_005610 [Diploptera punctata]|uniref:Cytochrome P450 n=1 Tax=Diploptera punctata TaxID=6984 RepID=A0AAD7ZBX0_DIPPU|nr:hypothetical protein L9F63_005610 [Diploptera punctata]
MITIFLAVVAIILLYRLLIFRPKNFPPGPPCLPIVGSIPFIPSKNVHFVMQGEWKKKYGNIVGLMFGQRPAIAVSGAEEVLECLRREEFQGRPDTFNSRDRAFYKRLGFFFNDGPAWLETRRFTLRHLKILVLGKSLLKA